MADDDDTEPDFVVYSDGTTEMNLENVTCAVNCPALRDTMETVHKYRSEKHDHFQIREDRK